MAADALSAFHNYSTAVDVDGDMHVSAQDVLAVINSINAHGSRLLTPTGSQGEATPMMVDVDNDGSVTASDVIRVINFINAHPGGEAGNTDNKAAYTLEILDANGNPLTDHDNTTANLTPSATIRAGSVFYVQLIGQDVRPAGFDTTLTPPVPLIRGIFAPWTDITFDTSFATPAVNEVQSISFGQDSGTTTLTLPPTPGHPEVPTGTTAPITYSTNSTTTAANIQSALNAALPGANVSVAFNNVTTFYNVTFNGITNVEIPVLTAGDPANVSVFETSPGDPSNTLGAVSYNNTFYPNGHEAGFVPGYGINDVGGIGVNSTTGFGRGQIPVLTVKMIANALPSGTSSSAPIVFTPDPLGDGSSSTEDMKRPDHNTLVFGNTNITTEREASLVTFGDPATTAFPANEFSALNPVTVTFNSGPINALPDALSFAEDEPSAANRQVNVLANDVNNGPPAGALQILSVSAPAGINVVAPGGGAIAFPTTNGNLQINPAADLNGTFSIAYTVGVVGDSTVADQTTQTLTVTIGAINDKPTLGAIGNLNINEDPGLQTVNLTGIGPGGGADESSQTVTITAVSDNPTLIANPTVNYTTGATGTLTFTPAANASGTAHITVTAKDDGGTANGGVDTVTQTFTVTVAAVNDAPVNTINGSDANGQHVVAVPFAAGGTPVSTPLAGFNVTDVDSPNLTVTLAAAAGTLNVPTATGVTGNGTATIVLTGNQSFITTELAGLAYTPVGGSTSATSLTITSSDSVAPNVVSNVTIDLDPGFRPGPIADSKAIDEGTAGPVTIDVLANDFKRPAPTVTTITATTQPSAGSITNNGTSLSYTMPADPDFFTPAGPLTFTYTIADDFTGDDGHPNATPAQATATVSINIKNVPDAPVATANDGPYGAAFDSSAATQTPLVVSAANGVLANDTDVDNNYGVSNYATLKAVVDTSTHRGSLTLNADGSFTYTPAAGTGDDSFTYHVNAVTPESGAAGVNSSTVTVNIHVTTPPTATNDHFNVLEQGNPATSGNVLTGANSNPPSAADSDDSDHQSLTAVNMVQLQNPATVGTVTLNTDGSFSYAPPAGQNFNTTRPAVPDLSFTYQAKTTDGRLSHVATVTLTVQDVNDPPTATNDSFLAVKQNADGSIGVDQIVTVLPNDTIAPDVSLDATGHVVTTGGDEFLSVVGVGLSAGGAFSTGPVATAGGGSVRVDANGKVLYTAPKTIPAGGHDTFFYQISDNSSASRNGGGPLFASASVDVTVVDFIPKTISGTVYVDSNGDGLVSTGERALSGVTLHLTGTDITNTAVSLTTTTDASGHYTFPAPGSTDVLKPPLAGTSYTVTEDQPLFMLSGLDTDLSTNTDTNLDPNNGHTGHLVDNSDRFDNSFLLSWSITDVSGNIANLNFGEGSTAGLINTNPNDGGLSNASGFKSELLASTGKNGFIAAIDMSGNIVWSWTIEGDAGAWAGHSLTGALLSDDLSTLDVTIDGSSDVTLTQGYLSSSSTARFRLLGSGLDASGQQMYIIRIDGSYDGSAGTFSNGLTDGMFASASLQAAGAQGEAPVEGNYASSADAVFAQQAWA
jgi:VCBS repeat-containing protein